MTDLDYSPATADRAWRIVKHEIDQIIDQFREIGLDELHEPDLSTAMAYIDLARIIEDYDMVPGDGS